MRIRHTASESYKVYNYLPCTSVLFKDVKRWFPYKHFATKQSALAAIKRIKVKYQNCIEKDLIWKIVWSPYPFASDEECITVYNEDPEDV